MLQVESTMLVINSIPSTNLLTPASVYKPSSEFINHAEHEQQHWASACIKNEDAEYNSNKMNDLGVCVGTTSTSITKETRPTGHSDHAAKTSVMHLADKLDKSRAAPTSCTMSTTRMVVPRHAGTSHTPTIGRKDNTVVSEGFCAKTQPPVNSITNEIPRPRADTIKNPTRIHVYMCRDSVLSSDLCVRVCEP